MLDNRQWTGIIGAAVFGGGIAAVVIGLIHLRNVELAKEPVRRAQEQMNRDAGR